MAETKTKADLDAERHAREKKETDYQAALEQEAENAKKSIASGASVTPIAEAKASGPRLVLKSEVVRRTAERFESYSVRIDGLTSSGEQLRTDIETLVLSDPTLLWPVHNRLPRFSEVILHSEYFTWEVRARVMSIDADLHIVVLSQIGPVIINRAAGKAMDWNSIQIANRGAKGKWSVIHKGDLLKDGFETEEQAEKWLMIKKLAA